MNRTHAAVRMGSACAAWIVVAAAGRAYGAALQVTSATVANAGDSARICVILSTGGQEVAGTQNDLTWDGNCASLSDESSCSAVGSHGKQLSASTKLRDFWLRALILSLSDTNPIPDGPLYCCNFQSEADPGQCCTINISNTGASAPNGTAIPASGGSGQLCTAASSDQPARGLGSMNRSQPLSASNAPPAQAGGGAAAPAAAAPAAAPARPPAAQVLQGGSERADNPSGAAQQAPSAAATPAPTRAAAVPTAAQVAPTAPQPALAPPTAAAPTSAATQALPTAPRDTPTRRSLAAATPAAPKPTPAARQAAAEPPAQASGGGWFGCQVAPGASPGPVMSLGLLALIGAALRRRATSHTQRSRGAYGDDE